ncbi:hypothetical protein G7Z17_g6809 [Cylindrodendrum hubeiense]|uniref:Sulfatase N-terminal domain-containing protein n=1 Tax=Cylindrodendrum hubeiense TaxID=595255 RepID=A0A9P5L7W8_9HYPO|nr:hypothetical protein G7Z17_g6809 [Cylindrodendrum hubeiense]
MRFAASFLVPLLCLVNNARGSKSKPNIVFIFTDDQDYRHGSLDTQEAIQKHLVAEGTLFTNQYATIAVCCPSRVSLMRGQLAHNTNNTAISAPGGGYHKFVAAQEDGNYLPHWLKNAGYKAEYIGKLFNGNNLLNYSPAPKGWSHIDVLLDPYINKHNSVVMSENGKKPKWYRNYQQTDVIRIKALDRLEKLAKKDDPFFLMIAPTAPHVEGLTGPPTPPSRYLDSFPNATVSRTPNFNPANEFQQGKPSWLKHLPKLNDTQENDIDHLFRRRLDSLRGVDDIVEDVVEKLKKHKLLENTYRGSLRVDEPCQLHKPRYQEGQVKAQCPPASYKILRRVNMSRPLECPSADQEVDQKANSEEIESLEDALHPSYDAFFDSFPLVTIEECMGYQLASNERPFCPEIAESGLGLEHRASTDNFDPIEPAPILAIPGNPARGGGWEHRHATLKMLLGDARELTDDEINNA